ncbi:hypothetical protein E11210_19560B, partial [Escherichia coli O104:H4 str. E112/10]
PETQSWASSGITVTTGRRWSWCSPPAVPRLLRN